MLSNLYQCDPALARRKVEAVYDPYDLTRPIRILWQGHDAGQAVIVNITRHSAPKATQALADETAGPAGSAATGIDYLRLLADQHVDRAKTHGIDYTRLGRDPLPGQTPLPLEEEPQP